MKPALPDVDALVDDLAVRLVDMDPRTVCQVKGPPAAGKSATLRRLAAAVRDKGFYPVIVAPPQREDDAAPSAVVDAVAGLKPLVNGELAGVLDVETSWDDKLNALEQTLAAHADRLVLFFDEPNAWAPRPWGDFPSRHEAVLNVLLRSTSNCRRVVAGDLPPGVERRLEHRLEAKSDVHAWMHDDTSWGEMAPFAASLERELGRFLAHQSPLVVRLVVALAAIAGANEAVRQVQSNAARRSLARAVIDAIARDASLGPLRDVCVRLSLVRRAFDASLLESMITDGLDSRARSILMHGLLFEDGGQYYMHDLIRLDVRAKQEWWRIEDEWAAHAAIGAALGARRSNTQGAAALPLEYEQFYHSACAADEGVAPPRPFFVEQLLEHARALSVRGQREHKPKLIESAANLYEKALAKEKSAYAYHYRSYNLDILGRDAARVAAGYEEAIAREPQHAWWHSRYIRFLITRARMKDARRAWDAALDALEIPSPTTDNRDYADLHAKVARLLLHRAQLDFAEEVIGQIPADAGVDVQALRDRLAALVDAQRGAALFPLSVPKSRWWLAPHKLPKKLTRTHEKLKKWAAGRVEHVGSSSVTIAVAEPPPEGEEPVVVRISMSIANFDKISSDGSARDLEGCFIEIGEYAKKKKLIRAHLDAFNNDERLPPLGADPDRYLRDANLT